MWLGKLEVQIMHLGRGHSKGDTVVWLPKQRVLFSGDLVERDATPYTGDAYLREWPKTLDKLRALKPKMLIPGRGDACKTPKEVEAAIAGTQDFLRQLVANVQKGVKKNENSADFRSGTCRDGAAVRQMGDLRALHAVRRFPRL